MHATRAGNSRRARYRPKSFIAKILGILGVWVLIIGTPIAVSGLHAHGRAAILGPIVGFSFAALGVVLIVEALFLSRSVRLTDSALELPGLFRTDVIPITDIAGVGLIFKHTIPPARSPPTGWYLNVWTDDGNEHVTTIAWVPFRFRKQRRGSMQNSFSARDYDAVVGTDPGELAKTHVAMVAKDLYARVEASQGVSGHLTQMNLQKRPARNAWSNSPATAYWSPDGEIGYPGAQHPRAEDETAQRG